MREHCTGSPGFRALRSGCLKAHRTYASAQAGRPDAAPEFRMRAVRLKMESPKIERMLEMVKTLRSAHKKDRVQQDGAEQPATAPESKQEGKKKVKPESEERSQ